MSQAGQICDPEVLRGSLLSHCVCFLTGIRPEFGRRGAPCLESMESRRLTSIPIRCAMSAHGIPCLWIRATAQPAWPAKRGRIGCSQHTASHAWFANSADCNADSRADSERLRRPSSPLLPLAPFPNVPNQFSPFRPALPHAFPHSLFTFTPASTQKRNGVSI